MSFTVQITPSAHQFTVDEQETVLEAALRQGIGLPYGCRNGQCGSCTGTLEVGGVSYPSGKTEALQGLSDDLCLTCQAVPTSDLRIRVKEVETATEIEVRILPCRVAKKEQLNHDVVRLYLKLPENQRLLFFAGQYLEFMLKDGRRRAFSIANAPHDDEFIELHLRHIPGGEFTDYAFDGMQEKAILRFQGPLGTFFLREDSDRPIVLIGGGTGFAPLKGIIEHAFQRGIRRPIELYWGVRARRDLYLPDLPRQWAEEHPNFAYTPVLSEPDADWEGRTGFVHEAVVADHSDMSGFDVYLSGPPVMVEAGRQAFLKRGLTMDHMFSDAFEYAADTPGKGGTSK